MEDDGFVLVKRGNKRRKSGGARHFLDRAHHSGLEDFVHLKSTINIGSIRISSLEQLDVQIEKCCADLRREHYLDHLKRSMTSCFEDHDDGKEVSMERRFYEIVCFGLGSFCESITSLYQLALLVCMRDDLKYSSKVTVYDPCFTDFEISALRSAKIDFHLLEHNTECRYTARGRTLFFMPHMYAVHYNNLIESNWDQLCLATLYCNSFEHLLSECDQEEFSHLHKLKNGQQYTILEQKVCNEFIFNDIFNNLSVHAFIRVETGKSREDRER